MWAWVGLDRGSQGGKASLSVPEQGDWSQDAHGGAKGSPAAESPIHEQHSPPHPADSRHMLLAPLAPPS